MYQLRPVNSSLYAKKSHKQADSAHIATDATNEYVNFVAPVPKTIGINIAYHVKYCDVET